MAASPSQMAHVSQLSHQGEKRPRCSKGHRDALFRADLSQPVIEKQESLCSFGGWQLVASLPPRADL